MEQRGLIKRQECGDDARGVWVVLTAEGGRAVLAATKDRNEAVREYFFDVLSPEEKGLLLSISTRVLDKIDPPICSYEEAKENSEAAASA
jgi:DNA-binding MarR family transcriptional regulator